MSTLLSTLVTQVRKNLNDEDATQYFWSDAELILLMNRGIRDLWRAINDNYQDYFLTIDATNVTLNANTSTLSGVPTDVSVIRGIEPRVRTTYPQLVFFARDYMHTDFANARARSAFDPIQGGTIYWHPMGAGAPVGAPVVQVAPQVSAAVPLRLVYVPTITEKVAGDANPIPGESDEALIAWTTAYAFGRQVEEQAPDPGWLSIYTTEKQSILVAITPRQTEDEEVVEALFEGYW